MRVRGIVGLVLATLVVSLTQAPLERMGRAMEQEKQLLYLPNGKHLRLMSLGHRTVLADWLYIWAIQYYSDYERADRYRYVEHLFGNVIAELDPNYVDAYWMGALILSVEAKDVDAAVRVLETGMERNPDQWVLPYLAAWECFHAKRYPEAERYFRRAAAIPGAPDRVVRMRAGAAARAGEFDQALQLWSEILNDPESDEAERTIAERQVRSLRVKSDLARIGRAIEVHRQRFGHHPARLVDLVRRGILRELPLDPDGEAYGYDPTQGEASSTAGRMLGDY